MAEAQRNGRKRSMEDICMPGGKKRCRVVKSTPLGLGPLPQELVSSILARLPVRDVRRASAVCKAWKREISSPQFMRDYNVRRVTGEGDAPNLALVSDCARQPSVAFSTELKRWVGMPSLFFEGERCVLVAQAKGLYVHVILPTANTDSEEEIENQLFPEKSQLVVSNPATGAIKWLPRMLRHTTHGHMTAPCVHLEIVEAGAAAYGYRITCIQVGADVDGKERCVEVYDSMIGSWSALEAPCVASSFGNPRCLSLVPSLMHHGTVYFVAVSSWMCQSVVSFNLEDRKWRMVRWFGKAIHDTYRSIRLAVCDDKLVCVLLRNTKAACDGVILVLDGDTKLPVHLPKSQLTHQMLRGGRRPVGPILGQGHSLYSLALEDGIMAAYDFRSKGWEEWPVSPVPYLRESTGTKLVDIQLGLLPLD